MYLVSLIGLNSPSNLVDVEETSIHELLILGIAVSCNLRHLTGTASIRQR